MSVLTDLLDMEREERERVCGLDPMDYFYPSFILDEDDWPWMRARDYQPEEIF